MKKFNWNIQKLLGLIFGVIGGCFLLAGLIILAADTSFKSSAVQTTATIIGRQGGHTLLEYEVEGILIQSSVSESSSNFRPGGIITVWYNPQNPSQVHTNVRGILGAVFSMVGGAFVLTTLILLLSAGKQNRRKRTLLESGYRIEAEITSVKQVYHVRMNRHHPYVIYCRGQDQFGQERQFTSEYLREDPQDLLEAGQIHSLPAYLDEQGHSYLDCSVLYADDAPHKSW